MPADGIVRDLTIGPMVPGLNSLTTSAIFTALPLSESANLNINTGFETAFSDRQLYLRLYKQTLSGNCADLDTANIVAEGFDGINRDCFASGDYVLQVMGTDSALVVPHERRYLNSYWLVTGGSSNQSLRLFHHLGTSQCNVSIKVTSQLAANKFSLTATGKYDAVNTNGAGAMQPLTSHVLYRMAEDTMGCGNTVVPDITCDNSTKASYHEFVSGR